MPGRSTDPGWKKNPLQMLRAKAEEAQRNHKAAELAGKKAAAPVSHKSNHAPTPGSTPKADELATPVEPSTYITLAQLLKKHDFAPSGGAAKHLARASKITVNGAPENRPGRKLVAGDVVVVDGKSVTVSLER